MLQDVVASDEHERPGGCGDAQHDARRPSRVAGRPLELMHCKLAAAAATVVRASGTTHHHLMAAAVVGAVAGAAAGGRAGCATGSVPAQLALGSKRTASVLLIVCWAGEIVIDFDQLVVWEQQPAERPLLVWREDQGPGSGHSVREVVTGSYPGFDQGFCSLIHRQLDKGSPRTHILCIELLILGFGILSGGGVLVRDLCIILVFRVLDGGAILRGRRSSIVHNWRIAGSARCEEGSAVHPVHAPPCPTCQWVSSARPPQ